MAFGTGCRSRVSDLDIQHALILNARLDENSALDDVKACAELLQLRGFSKNGVVGFCLGGRLAPLSLARGAGDVAVADIISARKSWITDYKAGKLSLESFKQKVINIRNRFEVINSLRVYGLNP